MICDDCLHQWKCMEQRGQCKDYKTLEGIRKEIESINKKYGQKAAVGTGTDQGAEDRPAGR